MGQQQTSTFTLYNSKVLHTCFLRAPAISCDHDICTAPAGSSLVSVFSESSPMSITRLRRRISVCTPATIRHVRTRDTALTPHTQSPHSSDKRKLGFFQCFTFSFPNRNYRAVLESLVFVVGWIMTSSHIEHHIGANTDQVWSVSRCQQMCGYNEGQCRTLGRVSSCAASLPQ